MARGSVDITAHDTVSGLGDSSKNLKKQQELYNKYYKQELQKLTKARISEEEKVEQAKIKAQKNVAEYIRKSNKLTHEERLKQLREEYNEQTTKLGKLKTFTKELSETLIGGGNSLEQGLLNAATKTVDSLTNGINEYLGAYSQYMTGIQTRLQGSGKTFESITGTISSALGASPYVSQKQVLENLSKLVDKGIAYNVEQRAFLGTVSEKIANTFDIFDGTLMQIIKIQQADSTAARLGMEATLTQFFNAQYRDTSYLSGLSDIVSASILGASTQLGRDRSVSFEYNVQKWLGSLSSVGVSNETIQQLAQGINYLGTGNVSALSSNTQLQNLLVMGSQRAGLDYSQILSGGLQPSDVNRLLSGITQFGQEIASTGNQVVKAQYAQLFGLTVTDLTALLNLSANQLKTIGNTLLSYEGAVSEVERQFSLVGSRTTLKSRIDTVFENVMSGVGEMIANSAGLYTTWLVNDLIENATGGINIPFISFMGSGIDLNANINQLIKLGIVGIGTLGQVGAIISGLSGNGGLSLNNWGANTTNISRGWGFTGISTSGVSSTTSQIRYIGSSDSSTIYRESLAGAYEQAETESRTSEEDSSKQFTESIDKSEKLKEILEIMQSWNDNGLLVRTENSIWQGLGA